MVEKASKDSWDALNAGMAHKGWEATRSKMPEACHRHSDVVAAYLVSDFETERALRAMTSGRMGMGELEPEGLAFHRKLSAYLRAWYKANR
jgi:hypothetical protein